MRPLWRLWWALAVLAAFLALVILRSWLTLPEPKHEPGSGVYYYTGYMKPKAERMRNSKTSPQ